MKIEPLSFREKRFISKTYLFHRKLRYDVQQYKNIWATLNLYIPIPRTGQIESIILNNTLYVAFSNCKNKPKFDTETAIMEQIRRDIDYIFGLVKKYTQQFIKNCNRNLLGASIASFIAIYLIFDPLGLQTQKMLVLMIGPEMSINRQHRYPSTNYCSCINKTPTFSIDLLQ